MDDYEVRQKDSHYEVIHIQTGNVVKRYRDIGLARRMAVALKWEAKKRARREGQNDE